MTERVAELCSEWLRGCSNAPEGKPWECEECTTAFRNALVATGWIGGIGFLFGGNAGWVTDSCVGGWVDPEVVKGPSKP